MTQSNEFMLLFRHEPSNEQPTPEQLQTMEQEWGAFFGSIAGQGKLVSTHHLGFEGKQISAGKKTSEGFNVANNLMLSGNMIVKVNSIDEATEIAKTCPILNMGGTVEVRSIQVM